MAKVVRINPEERFRFGIITALLFINSIIVQSNGVVAISGFINKAGIDWIPLIWGVDNLIIFLSAAAYSLISDRFERRHLAIRIYTAGIVVYAIVYLLFTSGVNDIIPYTVLMILNDQQWIVFALMLWALAGDLFLVAETKRLFPLIALGGFVGGIAGNGLAALVARLVGDNVYLMLFNIVSLLISILLIDLLIRKVKSTTRQEEASIKPKEILQDGLNFVRSVPVYRYLALAMLLIGIGLNTVEYQLVIGGHSQYPGINDLQAFLGIFRMVRMISLLLVQTFVGAWVLKNVGFKSVFIILPTLMFIALIAMFFWPILIVIAGGEYLVRISQEGIDDHARRGLVGMIPDEMRGRVSAFLDGYLYPLGAIISCILIGVSQTLLPLALAQKIYIAISALSVLIAIWLVFRLQASYDDSMLHWLLRRRKRTSSVMDKLNF